MRVVAGKAKGKQLRPVPHGGTRPILDRVKTALFDILRPRLAQMRMLDLFAGSGSVGIEALSQGAAHCVFIEMDQKAIQTIKQNLAHTGLEREAAVLPRDAFNFIKSCQAAFDLIYVAPPQYMGMWAKALRGIDRHLEILTPGGWVIAQIDPKEYQPLELDTLSETRQKKYGNTLLVFYERKA
ncbi:MAG: 16S rRNA (guanine(966)-N(2))-methyltransferase RsmD [Deltaproteobacteria bacterium]|nr:16S rRNA (guanine(966)-N(2))-methyltransferase RsmD [Deltaproteobacteria bacterium]